MSDLGDLYQQVILDHYKKPRNFQKLPGANRSAEGYNPLCGDHVKVYVLLDDNAIRDISFEGSGCAISRASASMMTESLKGRTVPEMNALFERFHGMVTGKTDGDGEERSIGKLEVFSGVSEFPARVKCATLAWHTLRAALEERQETVSTE